jgi:hypothetical protein
MKPHLGKNGDGRDHRGRFTTANSAARGHVAPHASRVTALRDLLFVTVRDADLVAIVRKLVAKARSGDVRAAELVLSYACGRPADLHSERIGPADLAQLHVAILDAASRLPPEHLPAFAARLRSAIELHGEPGSNGQRHRP